MSEPVIYACFCFRYLSLLLICFTSLSSMNDLRKRVIVLPQTLCSRCSKVLVSLCASVTTEYGSAFKKT